MRMDDKAVCRRCGGTAHDYAWDDGKGEVTIQCCYCLEFCKVFGYAPVETKQKSKAGQYVLKYGRYADKTIAEVAEEGERAVEYLRLLAKDSPKMKPIIEEFFESRSAVSVKSGQE